MNRRIELGNLIVEATDTNVFIHHKGPVKKPGAEAPIVAATMVSWDQWLGIAAVIGRPPRIPPR